jgi:2-polyprenyl-3-methyl-5-hydroxy-6-metoxy-1,4-benzoquinol methylase
VAGDVAHRARRRVGRARARVRGHSSTAPTPYYGDPAAYWEQRHQQFDDRLDGIGTKGMGQEANLEDYESKWEHLRAMLATLGLDGAAVLDAGCGIGWFTERLAADGHGLTAVDFSASAVEIARRRLGDQVDIEVGRLDQYQSGRTFPLVVCIDVLFHIVDDEQWRATLANLATQVAADGAFVVQDHLVDTPADVVDTTTTHTRWRSVSMYEAALPAWEIEALDHYLLPREGQTKDLMVFRRR